MQFTDSHKHTWSFAFTAHSLRRVREETKYDLTEPFAGEPPLIDRLFQDIFVATDILWSLCQDQAQDIGLTRDEFEQRLDAATLKAARQALLDELADFFRSLGRSELAATVSKSRELFAEIQTLAIQELEQVTSESVLSALPHESPSGPSSTNLADSSVSTPPLSVFAGS